MASRSFNLVIVFALLLSILGSTVTVTPVRAASITVTTTADILDAGVNCLSITVASLPGPGGQTSLREAVCAANNNAGADTITFSVNGTFSLTGAVNEDNGGSGDLDIKNSLTIQGNGSANTIIDGGGIERIFDVFPSAASTFNVSDLTLQNGDTRSTSFKEGGAIYLHSNVTTTLTNVQVINNFSGANGAIENRGALTISSSVLSGNQTIPASGNVVGGAIHNAGTLTIDKTTIDNNSVRGEGGGIASSTIAAVVVNITNSTISNNTASVTGGGLGNGGGIATTGNQGIINITNTTISNNHADNNGGGVYLVTPGGGTGNYNLTNVTFTNNISDNDNNGSGTGGGIAQNTATVVLKNTIVAKNFNSIVSVFDDISGTVSGSSSNNLIGDGTGASGISHGVNNNQVGSNISPIDPLLGVLQNNGSSTLTHALLVDSPAINTGTNTGCPSTDQRGTTRPQGGTCDIGSFELVLTSTLLVNSVLPTSRIPAVAGPVTIFNTVVNGGANKAYGVTLSMSPAPAGTFTYTQTNCNTNAVIGSPNTPVDIAAGGVACYVLSFTPSAPFSATQVHIQAQASNASATTLLPGINTWLLRATASQGPDIIALTTTTDFHQVACSGSQAFAVAMSNVGTAATGDITVSANTGSASLPISVTIQETNPGSGVVIGDNILNNLGAGENRTVAVFVTFNDCISFDPAANRIFIEFKDASDNVVGSTSTAVSTNR